MTRVVDTERQSRGVKLMLAIVGAILLAIGWWRWSAGTGLFG